MKEGRRNRYYWTCAACSSNLDHSERCNCAETKTASPRADRLLPKANKANNHFDATPVYHELAKPVNRQNAIGG